MTDLSILEPLSNDDVLRIADAVLRNEWPSATEILRLSKTAYFHAARADEARREADEWTAVARSESEAEIDSRLAAECEVESLRLQLAQAIEDAKRPTARAASMSEEIASLRSEVERLRGYKSGECLHGIEQEVPCYACDAINNFERLRAKIESLNASLSEANERAARWLHANTEACAALVERAGELNTERALRETAEWSRDMWRETAGKHAMRMERAEAGCHAAMFASFVHELRAEWASMCAYHTFKDCEPILMRDAILNATQHRTVRG